MRFPLPMKALSRQFEQGARGVDEAESSHVGAITIAVEQGMKLGHGARRMSPDELERVRRLSETIADPAQAEAAYRVFLELIRQYPADPRLQIFALKCVETKLPDASVSEVWRQLHERFPRSQSIAVHNLRRTIRFSGFEKGWDVLREEFPSPPDNPAPLLLYIALLEELRDFQSVDICIDRLVEMPGVTASHLQTSVQLYRRRGNLLYAAELARIASEKFPKHPGLNELQLKLSREVVSVVASFPDVDLSRERISVALLKHILEKLAQARPPEEETESRFVGRIVLVGGSLGVGGAERQFVATAVSLQHAIDTGRKIAGFDILGPVEVICRSLHSRRDGDFFLAELEHAGIRVDEYINFLDYGGRIRRSVVAAYDPILRHLPRDIAEATRKLADILRARAPQVIHIWQDGAIISCLLAALIAEIPRIVLCVRTLPSIDRLDRYRPEYETLYKTALNTPGVRLIANSTAVARRYAAWLHVSPRRVGVIHNGVRPPAMDGDVASVALAEKFGVAKGNQNFVVGTVMRFDHNKRPLLWVEVALAILARDPATRFVLVGEGPLLDSAKELARRSGRGDSFLFVGRSNCVGFWLDRMSVFLLLSLHESLPNGLIEAQFAGVPVVSTPAGGAAETFIDGETGTLLEDSEQVDVEDTADAVFHWKLDQETAVSVAALASETAKIRFSMETMAESTMVAYTD